LTVRGQGEFVGLMGVAGLQEGSTRRPATTSAESWCTIRRDSPVIRAPR